MSRLIDDLKKAADWVAGALQASGYRADFGPASLREVDRFMDDHAAGGSPRPDGLLAEDTGARLFAPGAYVGEVLRRALGGEWRADDADPEGELNVQLRLPEGEVLWPVQRIVKRLSHRAGESLAAYGAALGLPVPPSAA